MKTTLENKILRAKELARAGNADEAGQLADGLITVRPHCYVLCVTAFGSFRQACFQFGVLRPREESHMSASEGSHRCRSEQPWIMRIVVGYNVLLIALFALVYVIPDDDLVLRVGAVYIILMAPWIAIVYSLPNKVIPDWLPGGIFQDIIVLILCGTLNSLLLYAILRRVMRPKT
jgi:hypothetical protein